MLVRKTSLSRLMDVKRVSLSGKGAAVNCLSNLGWEMDGRQRVELK